MLSVHLICVGKLKEKFYLEACAEYVKRLSGYCKLQVVELPEERLPQNPSQGQIDAALEKEADAIRAKLPPSASLVALCVEGKLRSSEEVARLLADWSQNSAKHLVFLIGGSYGLHPSCCWSRSTAASRSMRGPAIINKDLSGESPKIRLEFAAFLRYNNHVRARLYL